MTIPVYLTVVLALLGACSSNKESEVTPESPTAKVSTPTRASEDPKEDARQAEAEESEVIALESLLGRTGFDWLKAATCQEVDSKVTKAWKAASAVCEKDGSQFGVADVVRCKTTSEEWLLFASAEDCNVAYETMEANAP